jgi:2-oxoglutarate ferredoxin oxidoreductase subunit delta
MPYISYFKTGALVKDHLHRSRLFRPELDFSDNTAYAGKLEHPVTRPLERGCRLEAPFDFKPANRFSEGKNAMAESKSKKPKLKQHHVNRDWCKGCGICVEFCPKHVLELDEEDIAVAVRPQDCICCKLCELRCPDLAIDVETE